MGVMCSLLGHDYGDADVERERAERGEEVVRTAKRVERCRNCGHERTVSENKEITALSAAAGVVREPDGTVVASTDELNEAVSEVEGTIAIENSGETATPLNRPDSDADDPVDVAEPTDVDESTDGDEQADETESVDEVAIDRIHDIDPETRDGPGRAPGEWPAEPDDEPAHAAKSGAFHDGSGNLSSPGSLAAGQSPADRWPGETDATEMPSFQSSAANGAGNGAESTADRGTSTRTGRLGDSFTCASCGFSAAVADSPLRAGDICPGCQHGYLAWETRKG